MANMRYSRGEVLTIVPISPTDRIIEFVIRRETANAESRKLRGGPLRAKWANLHILPSTILRGPLLQIRRLLYIAESDKTTSTDLATYPDYIVMKS